MGRSSLILVTLTWLLAYGPGAFAQVAPEPPPVEEEAEGSSRSEPEPPALSSLSGERDLAPSTPGTPQAVAEAEVHFAKSLEYYRKGDYRAASWELHWALFLDPESKDLEYNLALVHEKQGELEEAIEHWRSFTALETSPVERERAEFAIERLEGALARSRGRELRGSSPQDALAPSTPGNEVARPFKRWAIGAGIVAAVALCAGTVLGVRALSLDPNRDASYGDASLEELEARASKAHSYAVGADLAFAVGAGAGVAAGLFWFAEPEGGQGEAKAERRALGLGVGGVF